jgi:alcohol dehydrogenase class IV
MPFDPWLKFHFPATVEFGAGCVRSIGLRLRGLGGQRPLVVSDSGVAEAGLLAPVVQSIEEAGARPTLWPEVRCNPTDRHVYAGTVRYREERCDSIVAVGGGSVMDVAKAVRILVAHPNPLPELYADAGGTERIGRPMPRLISVPTTAGTGSEVTRVAVIGDSATHRKRILAHPRMTSTIAMLDPLLTLGLPPALTAATGADALAHCVEAYLSTAFHPIADGIALEGVRLVRHNLPIVLSSPSDPDARGKMLLGACMGGLAGQKGGGAGHSLAHPLSEMAGVSHGLANALVLPYVMEFNRGHAAARLAEVGRAMGASVGDMSPEAAAGAAVESVHAFVRGLGLPKSLAEMGVRREQIPELAAAAIADRSHVTNPRPCTEEDMERLYLAAYEG